MSNLRPYQQKIIAEAKALMHSGVRSILITAPTGSGKTLLTAHMIKTAVEKGFRGWFIVHRRELIKQSADAFAAEGIDFGIISNGFREKPRATVQICSIQTLVKRYHKLDPPGLVVFDEAHHVAAASWETILHSTPQAFHVGLTATPIRLDGKGLGNYFQAIVSGPGIPELTEQGYLSPYRLYAPSTIDLSAVHTRMGDYVRSELAAACDKPVITGRAIDEYRRLCPGKRAAVFCVSVQHSQHTVAEFNAVGIKAAHIDGETAHEERDRIVAQFAAGEIQVLSNVDLIGEGFDLPALEAVILLRPTKSLGLFLQQVGRSLRVYPGKSSAIILDHAGNCERHGLPDDERDFTLEGLKDRRQNVSREIIPVRICKQCFAAQRPGKLYCIYCGHEFEPDPRVVEEVEGILREIDLRQARVDRKREQGKAQSLEALIALGKQRGYRNPTAWARHLHAARMKRRAA